MTISYFSAAQETGNLATAATNTGTTATKTTAALVSTPAIYNVTMTNANAEYSQALPANVKRYQIGTQDGTAFRLAFVTGKVATPTAPYYQTLANEVYSEVGIDPAAAAITLYFACASAGKIVQIIAWT